MNREGHQGKEKEIITTNSEVADQTAYRHKKEDMKIDFLGFEPKWWESGVLESINIRREKPTLNADCGRYNLSRIWDGIINTANDERNQCIGDNNIGGYTATTPS